MAGRVNRVYDKGVQTKAEILERQRSYQRQYNAANREAVAARARVWQRVKRLGHNPLSQRRCKWCREVVEGRDWLCSTWCRENRAARNKNALTLPEGWVLAGGRGNVLGVNRGTIKRWMKAGMPFEVRGGRRVIHVPTAQEWKAKLPKFGRGRQRYGPPPVVDDPAEAGVIYALCNPRTDEVRYIGKTTNLRRRLSQYRCDPHSPHLRNWFAHLKREGLEPKVKVLEECLFGLCEAEKKWIAHGRRKGWRLINLTEGGGSTKMTADVLRRLGERSKARWADPVYRQKAVAAAQATAARRLGITIEEWRNLPRTPCGSIIKPPKPKPPKPPTKQVIERERKAQRRAKAGVSVPLTHRGSAFVHLTRGAVAVVDLEDWQRVTKHRWSLQVKDAPHGEPYLRAKRTINHRGGRRGIELLNRFVAQADNSDRVRHRNGDQLDCRKSNLIVSRATAEMAAA